jgi:hypothetical protein
MPAPVGAPANFDESRSFHPNCAAPLFLGIGNVKARNCRRMPRSPAPILCTRNGALPVSSTICGRIRERVRYTMSAMSAGTRFTIAIFHHLVGMVGLFMGYGLEWVASSLLRRSTNAEQVRAWLRIYRLSLPISGAGLLLLILSGVYFASIFDSMKEGWLLSSLLATVFAFGIGFVFILPRVRMLRAVLPEGNTPLSEAGRASVQDPVILTLIRVRFLLTLGILYLMITKPDLATSLFILLGAIVVGLISAATAWTARPRSLS